MRNVQNTPYIHQNEEEYFQNSRGSMIWLNVTLDSPQGIVEGFASYCGSAFDDKAGANSASYDGSDE